jgi:hypothetical protein
VAVRNVLVVVASGCWGGGAGTQIGLEQGKGCERVSSEVVEGTAVPEGFVQPAEAVLAAHLGPFEGLRYDLDEEPSDEAMRLVVTWSRGEIVLERFEPNRRGMSQAACPDSLRTAVQLVLDGSPAMSFQGTVDLRSPEAGTGLLEWTGLPTDFAAIPDPSFDPTEADGVDARIGAGRAPDGPWWMEVAWGREVWSREPGVGLTREYETVFWGQAERLTAR